MRLMRETGPILTFLDGAGDEPVQLALGNGL
jgi:hypothetical protein